MACSFLPLWAVHPHHRQAYMASGLVKLTGGEWGGVKGRTDAIIHEKTVVVEAPHAALALAAVVGARRAAQVALFAEVIAAADDVSLRLFAIRACNSGDSLLKGVAAAIAASVATCPARLPHSLVPARRRVERDISGVICGCPV